MKKRNSKGFTLAELLIVVAIIGVLTAIAIPVFTAQLEKSREAVDAANIRAMYAVVMADALTGDLPDNPSVAANMTAYNVELKQQTAGWSTEFDFPNNLIAGTTDPVNTVTVTFTYADGEITTNIKLAP